MPFYEYECQACGGHVETLQKISDAPLTDCPACGKAELKKLISASGFRLKGAGWYETDFKNKGKKNLHEAAKADSATVADKSEKKAGDDSGPKAKAAAD